MTPTSNDQPVFNDDAFPCLYDEVIEMAFAAVAVFGMADLRRVARSGKQEDQAFLQLPTPGEDVRQYFLVHRDSLKGKLKMRELQTLSMIFDENENDHHAINLKQDLVSGSTLHHVGDENASHECVYTITTNSVRKRIVVTFRGSITIRDWIQDSKLLLADVENPFAGEEPDQPETVQIHYGFKQYLYDDAPSILPSSISKLATSATKHVRSHSSQESKDQEDEEEEQPRQSKVDEILEKVEALLNEHPDYKVYIAGHSLGGALSLVFAMEAAARLQTGLPVTCIVLGNPRTGNLAFRQLMRCLEEKGRLRCLCIHNQGDMVPRLPDVMTSGCYLCICRRHRSFRHVGLRMKISAQDFHTSYATRIHETWSSDVARQIKNFFRLVLSVPWAYQCVTSKGFSKRHDYQEYLVRLLAQEKEMRKIYLDDLYKSNKG